MTHRVEFGGGTQLQFHTLPADAIPERPQWSPPVSGGMTRSTSAECLRHPTAAMEPALHGQDDSADAAAARHPAVLSTMEPAVDRRDDAQIAEQIALVNLPQWSPPLIGGLTRFPPG